MTKWRSSLTKKQKKLNIIFGLRMLRCQAGAAKVSILAEKLFKLILDPD